MVAPGLAIHVTQGGELQPTQRPPRDGPVHTTALDALNEDPTPLRAQHAGRNGHASWRRRAAILEEHTKHDARAYYMRRLLAVADAVGIAAALAGCAWIERFIGFGTEVHDSLLLAPLFLTTWLFLAGAAGMYHVDDRRIDCSIAEEIFRVAQLVALWIWFVFLLIAIGEAGSPGVAPAVALGVLAVPAILSCRAIVRRVARHRDWYMQSAVIVGTEQDCSRVTRTLVRHPEYGIVVTDTLHPSAASPRGNGTAAEARIEALISTVERDRAHRVIFASSYEGIDERTGALRFLSEHGIKVDLVAGDSDIFRSDAELHQIEGLPLLTLPTTARPRSAEVVKRGVDVLASGISLTLLSPLLLGCAIAIKLDDPGPVLFRQRRVGRGGKLFTLFKFRTMVANAEELKPRLSQLNRRRDGMFKIPADPRVTRVGGWMRRHSLDELPQLLNVLTGDMSLVGPRPLIEVESEQVSEHYSARFNVRPGITGPWQVLGRSDIPFQEMVKLDYTYVTNWRLGDDLKLMVRTLSAMSAGNGAY